jgi:hypothetical protein
VWAAGVKVRKAKSDPDAKNPFQMTVRPECAQVSDYVHIPYGLFAGAYGGGDD